MNNNGEKGSRFSAYDRPRSTQGTNNEGNGEERGTIKLTGGNVAGGGNPWDSEPSSNSENSDSPPFDKKKILCTCKDHREEAWNANYNNRLV